MGKPPDILIGSSVTTSCLFRKETPWTKLILNFDSVFINCSIYLVRFFLKFKYEQMNYKVISIHIEFLEHRKLT